MRAPRKRSSRYLETRQQTGAARSDRKSLLARLPPAAAVTSLLRTVTGNFASD
jgi:hypothetical protein